MATEARDAQIKHGIKRIDFGRDSLLTLFAQVFQDRLKPELFTHVILNSFNRFNARPREQSEVLEKLLPEEYHIKEGIISVRNRRLASKGAIAMFPGMKNADQIMADELLIHGK